MDNLYVRKSELDAISQEYGIPKNLCRIIDISSPAAIGFSIKPEIDNVTIDSNDSARNLIVDFTRSILKEYPNAKTADLRRNCFENMGELNSRDGKVINDVLIKAGAMKSNPGEHAKKIEWRNKYPKEQWMRVFNKKIE